MNIKDINKLAEIIKGQKNCLSDFQRYNIVIEIVDYLQEINNTFFNKKEFLKNCSIKNLLYDVVIKKEFFIEKDYENFVESYENPQNLIVL